MWATKKGFTIVELLIIIVVIAILAAIVIVVFNGVANKARLARVQGDIRAVQRQLEAYSAANDGQYPKTTNNPHANWRAADVRTDVNCQNGSKQSDWIPDLNVTLPQSDQKMTPGVDGVIGCYLYASDGIDYVISAWNMVSPPQSSVMYRRLGFREFQSSSSTQFYTCNANAVGGAAGGYNINDDYYKHSYTLSNIKDCNETPPAGA